MRRSLLIRSSVVVIWIVALSSGTVALAQNAPLEGRPDTRIGEGRVEMPVAQRYLVTVTNLTLGQVLSPPVVISHNGSFRLFNPGEAASPELAMLAEDAVSDPLLALLGTLPEVLDAQVAGGPIPPGGSGTVEIDVQGTFRSVTVAGMLVTTNDAFFAATSSTLPAGKPTSTTAVAWDAGSEANSESCDHIPGPPCGNPLVPAPGPAEGYVHVHAGIHGIGSLMPYMHDWNNPTAAITIERAE
jgi:hypothetical protein